LTVFVDDAEPDAVAAADFAVADSEKDVYVAVTRPYKALEEYS